MEIKKEEEELETLRIDAQATLKEQDNKIADLQKQLELAKKEVEYNKEKAKAEQTEVQGGRKRSSIPAA